MYDFPYIYTYIDFSYYNYTISYGIAKHQISYGSNPISIDFHSSKAPFGGFPTARLFRPVDLQGGLFRWTSHRVSLRPLRGA